MGKAKDGSECYTRQNKSGGAYVTCEGSQKGGSAREKGKRRAKARKLTTRPAGRIDTNAPRNVGIVDKSKPPPKPKPKPNAKASGKKQVSMTRGNTTITWTVPKHTVNQTDSLKVLRDVDKNYEYGGDPIRLDIAKGFTNDKPFYIDARIEGNRIKYKELDIPRDLKDIKYRAKNKVIKPK